MDMPRSGGRDRRAARGCALVSVALLVACGQTAERRDHAPASFAAVMAPAPREVTESQAFRAEVRREARGGKWRVEVDGLAKLADPDDRGALFEGGIIKIYDRKGQLRVKLFDPSEPGLLKQVTVIFGGLSDWVNARAKRARLASAHKLPIVAALAQRVVATERSLDTLGRALEQLWSDRSKTAAERRRLIFTQWDECEGGERTLATGVDDVLEIKDHSEALSRYRAYAGDRARALIEAFVREHMPKGSAHGFHADELAALNRGRQSARVFDPYTISRPPRAVAAERVEAAAVGESASVEGPRAPASAPSR
ncbi:MAG: hypothetical protein KC636_15630 [Myxococcales bacterium]|nr:hypothetical protein [Myxococcales bacterium]